MAFNVLHTFQKNRRFWMAAVLMICMVSFVFCTGMQGDMADRLPQMFGGRGGQAIAVIDGHNIGSRDLHELKAQRTLANDFMKICANRLFEKLSQEFFDHNKKMSADKDGGIERRKLLSLIQAMKMTVAQRKSRPRYFDIGVKFDDLLEFRLWQAEADRLGIKIEEGHLEYLFGQEFFNNVPQGYVWLEGRDLLGAQHEAMRNNRDANDRYLRRAVAEEFRVKIAQYATLGFQANSFYFRRRGGPEEGITPKFTDPDVPDEIRAPMTLAQLWDAFKIQRSEFDVTLIPVDVKPFIDKVKEPDDQLKRDYYEANKSKAYDPSSENSGLESPLQISIEYVYADPMSPAYLDLARTVAQLKVTNPIAFDALQSPLVTAVRSMAIAQKHQDSLQRQLDAMVSKVKFSSDDRYRGAALYSDRDCTTPILAFLAKDHPEAITSLFAGSVLSPTEGMAGFLAWGAVKHSDQVEFSPTSQIKRGPQVFEAAVQSEVKRRVPVYKDLLAWSFTDNPLHFVAPYLSMDTTVPRNFGSPAYIHPPYTIETAQHHIQELLARQTAEEWAQENMYIVKQALEKAVGDPDKYRRELNQYVSTMKLTYGPADKLKGDFYNRFSISDAKEFEVLKESYRKYVDQINMFEGRDLSPERLLKPTDFHKMFFDSAEKFSATALYRAMPWPPEVTPSNARFLKRDVNDVDPRLINRDNVIEKDLQRFTDHLQQNNPNRQAPNLELFKNAALPILFWRTGETNPSPPSDYKKLGTDLQKAKAELVKLAGEMKTHGKDAAKMEELRAREAGLRKSEADLTDILNRITEGLKFTQARTQEAIPRAHAVAKKLIEKGNPPALIESEAGSLNRELIKLVKLAKMKVENTGGRGMDYFPPTLPKDKIAYPRDDMMQQVLSLYDMKGPIVTGSKDLDDVNKELFELAAKQLQPQAKYVQVLTNKPRSVFYVAAITAQPFADKTQFQFSMFGAPHLTREGGFRDFFADRVQEQEARRFRADFIRGLREAHGFSITNDEARKDFDDRVVGD